MGWVIFGCWALGVISTWRTFAIGLLEGIERDFPSLELDNGDRIMCATFAVGLALAWPVSLPIRTAYRLAAGHASLLRTPKERAAAEREELERLRKLAREYDLPLLDEKRGKGAA